MIKKTLYLITGIIFIFCILVTPVNAADYKTQTYDWIARIYGEDRYETAVAISQEIFPSGFISGGVVIISTGENFPDALSGASLGGALLNLHVDCSLLSTKSDTLPNVVINEIIRLNPTGLYILGGYNAVSWDIEETISNLGYEISRLSGFDRYETAAVAAYTGYNPEIIDISKAFIATGWNYPDALSAVPAAYAENAPILLTQKDNLPDATRAYLADVVANQGKLESIRIVGGTSVIAWALESELREYAEHVFRSSGLDRYETAVSVARDFFDTESTTGLVMARGDDFPDALSGGMLGMYNFAPVVLTQTDILPSSTEQYLYDYTYGNFIYLLGGYNAISPDVEYRINEVTGGGVG